VLNHTQTEFKMSKVVLSFEKEKETKNSIRFKEVPEPGKAAILGTVYVQRWFAGEDKNIEITIEKRS